LVGSPVLGYTYGGAESSAGVDMGCSHVRCYTRPLRLGFLQDENRQDVGPDGRD
jgi:hypothetical protein